MKPKHLTTVRGQISGTSVESTLPRPQEVSSSNLRIRKEIPRTGIVWDWILAKAAWFSGGGSMKPLAMNTKALWPVRAQCQQQTWGCGSWE